MQRAALRPTPVGRPDMHGDVVDVPVGMHALAELLVHVAADDTFAACRYEVVRVNAFDKRSRFGHPLHKRASKFFGKGARLVAELPGHDVRVVLIGLARKAIGAADNCFHKIEIQLLCLTVAKEFGGIIHVARPAIPRSVGRIAVARLAQIVTETAAPIPRISQIEHGIHIPLFEFRQHTVQTRKQRIVEHTRLGLQHGRDRRDICRTGVSPYKDAQIVHPDIFQRIQFATEARQVAALPFRSQNRCVPKIGAHKIIRLPRISFIEMRVALLDKIFCRSVGKEWGHEEKEEKEFTKGVHIQYYI